MNGLTGCKAGKRGWCLVIQFRLLQFGAYTEWGDGDVPFLHTSPQGVYWVVVDGAHASKIVFCAHFNLVE